MRVLLGSYGRVEQENGKWFLEVDAAPRVENSAHWLQELRDFFGSPGNADSEIPKRIDTFLRGMTTDGLAESEANRPVREYLSERFDLAEAGGKFKITLTPQHGDESDTHIVMDTFFGTASRREADSIESYFRNAGSASG
ncbi:hypothetical protein, partial [Streptomyces sp. NPDC056160]|uniref:hypothetical protein n=1 Tax=Streptomyces sp. NPDC056160 TaxID=3345731 RepID=UPI0035DB0D97